MTVPPIVSPSRYVANGSTLNFAYNFAISSQSEILVLMNDAVQLYGTHYTLTGIGSTNGGLVQFTFFPPDGARITILRNQAISQVVNFLANFSYSPLTVGDAFNDAAKIDQMLAEQIARSLKFSPRSNFSDITVAEPEVGKFLTWAANGDIVNVAGTPAAAASPLFPLGVTTDGVTDVTGALQTALSAAGLAKRRLYIPAGTYVVNDLTIPSDVHLIGDGKDQTIIKRKNGATGNLFINAPSSLNFTIEGIGFDGNGSNQTNGANNLTFSSCGNWKLNDIKSINAFGAVHGTGLYVANGVDQANFTRSYVINSTFRDNARIGMALYKSSLVTINGNFVYNNPSGGILGILVLPPELAVQNLLTIHANVCRANNDGIAIYGFFEGGSLTVPIYGHDIPPSQGVIISNNQCELNTQYGIIYQSLGGVVSGNYCRRNGTGVSYGAGMLVTAQSTTVIGNVLHDNGAYGIDAGWSLACSFIGNAFNSQGLTSGQIITGLNLGREFVCIGNVFRANGTAVGGSHILIPGFDLDAANFSSDVLGAFGIVADNQIISGHTSVNGITAFRGFDNLVLRGNVVAGCTNPYLIQAGGDGLPMRFIESDNVNWNAGQMPEIASSSPLIIPDVGDRFLVTGINNFDTIKTVSSNGFFQKVRFIQITNGGTGYTSAPAVGFTGGGGSAAAGTAILGCDNFHGREIKLVFGGVLTVADATGNLVIAGNLVTQANTTLHLIGNSGNWCEIGRSVN